MPTAGPVADAIAAIEAAVPGITMTRTDGHIGHPSPGTENPNPGIQSPNPALSIPPDGAVQLYGDRTALMLRGSYSSNGREVADVALIARHAVAGETPAGTNPCTLDNGMVAGRQGAPGPEDTCS